MLAKFKKLNLKRRFTLRTALTAAASFALVVSATVFMTASAADNVSPSDVSPTSHPTGYHSGAHSASVSSTDVSASDEVVFTEDVTPKDTIVDPANLGEPVITMTTEKNDGEELFGSYMWSQHDFTITGQNVYVDYGDGNPVAYPGDRTVKGKTIRIYGDNITELLCSSNQLSALDVSGCTSLKVLDCCENQLTSLDLSRSTALEQIDCSTNQLTSLDVSNNPDLWTLHCEYNQLTSLDVSNNPDLWTLHCECNHQLTSLDVSKNTNLTELFCFTNQLTTLDVSNNPDLWTLYCAWNPLTTLDVSKNTSLQNLECCENQLTTLDVSKNTSLLELNCSRNQIQSLNVTNNMSLVKLECGTNEIPSLDVSKNTALTRLNCSGNPLAYLDVSHNTALTRLNCAANSLTSLDLQYNADLERLECFGNKLTSLDISHNKKLTHLDCLANQLASLDLSQNTELAFLNCRENNLTALDLSKNTKLLILYCEINQLKNIDVKQNTALAELYCDGNQLTSLDLSKNTCLGILYCLDNELTSLDVSNNPNLKMLKCSGNQLTTLDLSHNTELSILECSKNQLTMPLIHGLTVPADEYAPQTHVIPSSIQVGESIDLSSEYSVDGTVTEFTWYDTNGNVITPATANGGVFTFGKDAAGKTLICKMANAKLPDFKDDADVEVGWNEETQEIVYEKQDIRLTTTAVTIEAAESEEPGEPVSPEEPVSSEDNSDNNGNGKVTPYYDLPFEQNEDIDDVTAVKYPEGTVVDVDGRVRNLHSLRGIQLTVGNIETNKKKSVLDAIKHYNESFDTDTTDIALYDITLEDNNKVHVKIVHGELLICLKYPDNLARQSEDYVFHLYHQKADGTIEEIPVTLKPNGIWFRAKDFSPYVLYWHVKAAESVGTGESLTRIIVMTALCALSLVGAGYVLCRRKKLTAE